MAATPSRARAQVGMEAEYVYFCIKKELRFCAVLLIATCSCLLPASS